MGVCEGDIIGEGGGVMEVVVEEKKKMNEWKNEWINEWIKGWMNEFWCFWFM